MRIVNKRVMFKGTARDATVVWIDDAGEAATVMQPRDLRALRGMGEWYGNQSPEDALKFARIGDETLVRESEALVRQLNAEIETRGFERVAAPCGAFPVVGDFLAGHPDCMRRTVPITHGPVRILMDTTSSGCIDADQLMRRGAALMALVLALTAEGRPVELHWTCALDKHREGVASVVVRCPTLPLNLGVCCHLLSSQAWVRGIGYTYLHGHGARGHWPFNTEPRLTVPTMREVYELAPHDVYIPAIFVDDELLCNPVAWLNRQLDLIRSTDNA